MEQCGQSEADANQTGNLKSTEEDIEKAAAFAKAVGIREENILRITGTTKDPSDDKPYMESAKTFGKKLNKLVREHFGTSKGKKFLFVYMSGHGASEDAQFFLLNAKDDVCFPVENKLRATAESYDVKVFAIYDICRSRLADYQAKRGVEADGQVGKEVNYMHLGATPRATIDADSEMADIFTSHMQKKADANGGLIHFPLDLADIGHGIQPTLPTVNDPYVLKYEP